MLCCESIVSSLFFFFFFFYTCKKKEFQSNFQINLVFFFSQHKVQIITNHSQRSHTSCDYPNTLSRMILRILRQKNHISLIFPSFFSSVLRFPSFFQTNKQLKKLLSRLTTSKRHRALEYFMKIPRFRNNV